MKIFISYARDDIKIAKKLYRDLRKENLDPFLDVEDILPGQKWELAINKAIKDSKYVIILISPNSMSKKGYIQKEIKYSLDLLDQFPDSEIFIIPVRLDNCEPTNEKLQQLNWADLFPSYEEGFKKILKAVKQESNGNIHSANIKFVHDFIINITPKNRINNKAVKWFLFSIAITVMLFFSYHHLSLNEKDLVSIDDKNVTITEFDRDNENQAFTNSLGMKFVYIPEGIFSMGSENTKGRDDDETKHKVKITKGFYIQATEVTQGQWKAVMGNNPSHFSECGENCPVEQISWKDSKYFINKLNKLENTTKYRLPTEAEWEYACNASNNNMYFFGNDDALLINYAWFLKNSGDKTHPVAMKKPNNFGIYDMLGNVFEWCEDVYVKNYEQLSKEDPLSNFSEMNKGNVAKGMTYYHNEFDLRCANRTKLDKNFVSPNSGLRIVKDF